MTHLDLTLIKWWKLEGSWKWSFLCGDCFIRFKAVKLHHRGFCVQQSHQCTSFRTTGVQPPAERAGSHTKIADSASSEITCCWGQHWELVGSSRVERWNQRSLFHTGSLKAIWLKFFHLCLRSGSFSTSSHSAGLQLCKLGMCIRVVLTAPVWTRTEDGDSKKMH